MELQEFKPSNAEVINARGDILEFKPFNLSKEVFIIERFGSLSNFIDELNKDGMVLIKILYKFTDHAQLKAFFEKTEIDKTIVKKLHEAFNKTVLNSQPIINSARYKDFLKAHSLTGDIKADYATYYDKFARRYSYKIDDFFKLTRRQLIKLMDAIQDGDYTEMEIQAAMANKKLKPRNKLLEISEEQEKDNEKQAMDALASLKVKHMEKVKI